MIWRIGDGYISFWWENWTGKGALAKLLHLATKSKKVMVADFIINGNWNELKLGQELPSSIVNDILQIQIYKGHDKIIWTAEPNGSIRAMVMQWWMTKTNNKIQETMHQCLPTILCWEIWKSRCNARFEGIKASTYRIIERVTWLMTLILNKQFPCLNFAGNWKELCIKIERVNLVLNIKFIKWREPPDNYLKLNTDGCSKGNPGEAGGGGILRDH
ncbi:hypothetical protein KY290_035344 [Solanum tuberosum]|uniref:RNase H type-1 domain-containing protein n=1 Tax=Solanum tuberosum TaxID=4113 RepID=A0ABQ7U5V5_SOLTU|nr:hypothetical protein KY290_035344 [Solanum tuberosum]